MVNDTRALTSQTTSDDRPKLVTIVALDGWDDSALLALTASVATGLDTPAAAAIVESARQREVQIRTLDQAHHTTGMGVTAVVAGHTVVLGNAAFFSALGLSIDNLGNWPERLRRRGERVLFVAIDGRTAGFLGVADPGADTRAHASWRNRCETW